MKDKYPAITEHGTAVTNPDMEKKIALEII